MPITNPAILAQLIGFGLFLWVGLYLLVRGARRSPLIIVSVCGLLAQALFFGLGALADTRGDFAAFTAIQRASLWTMILPAATWLHFSHLVAQTSDNPARLPVLFPRLVVAAYTAAAALTIFGSISNLVNDYSQIAGVPGAYSVRAGAAYPVYMAYMLLVAGGAAAYLLRARRALRSHADPTSHAQARLLGVLLAGAVAFLAGALWLMSRKSWELSISVLPGYMGLMGGLAALGYGVAHYGLLLEGQNIRRDFVYHLTGVGALNLLYGGLLLLAGPASVASALVLITLVTCTHTLFDAGRALLDRLFFSSAEQAARSEARDYAAALATTPVTAPTEALERALPDEPVDAPASAAGEHSLAAFRHQVRRALTGLKSPPRLAQSPLLALALVERRVAEAGESDNRLNRASALREILIEQIEALRPRSGDEQPHRVGEAWRFYNVLYYPYVRELSRKSALAEARRLADERRRAGVRAPGELEQVLAWLADVDEDTFYKWQRRASDTIATILWEAEIT